jgi:hypothetical protein
MYACIYTHTHTHTHTHTYTQTNTTHAHAYTHKSLYILTFEKMSLSSRRI